MKFQSRLICKKKCAIASTISVYSVSHLYSLLTLCGGKVALSKIICVIETDISTHSGNKGSEQVIAGIVEHDNKKTVKSHFQM